MIKVWMAVKPGGGFRSAWNATDKVWYYPAFTTHDDCLRFWHGKTDDRRAWGVSEVELTADNKLTREMLEALKQYADKDNWCYYDESGCPKGIGESEDSCILGPGLARELLAKVKGV